MRSIIIFSFKKCTWHFNGILENKIHLLLSVFWIIAILVGMKCYLIVLLIFIPPVTNDVEYLFVCAYCLFVYFLWRNVCSYPLFIFHLSYLSLLFWILVPYHMCCAVLSHFSQLCETLWTSACQAPLSMGFSQQEY